MSIRNKHIFLTMKKFILTRSSAFWGGGITLIYSYIGFSKKMRPYAANLYKNKYIVYLMNQIYIISE